MQAAPSQPIVLVIFQCQTGDTEALALRAAVGAVQSRALIRLRRIPEFGLVVDTEPLLRMRKEYVPPTEKDILGADSIILVATPGAPDLPWLPWIEFVNRHNKAFTWINTTDEDALTVGRAVAEAARALKNQQEQS
jgi:hypothetical protein